MELNRLFSFMNESFAAAEKLHFQTFSSNFSTVSFGPTRTIPLHSARSFGDLPDLFQELEVPHFTTSTTCTTRYAYFFFAFMK